VTLRVKLTLWYGALLSFSLLVLSAGLYYELVIEAQSNKAHGKDEPVESEIDELILFYELPALALALFGGWWLTKKALAPISAITNAAASINSQNLFEQLPRTGNGDEIDRLVEIMNSMLRRLEKSFARERDFTLHSSHELKTPLTVMRAQIETALREEALPKHKDFLESLLEETGRLAGILDSLSFLAKADAGLLKLDRQEIRLDELVRDAFEDTIILAHSRNIAVSLEQCDPLIIEGDKGRLRQLLLNLADNAVKHNETGGKVNICLTASGNQAQLRISNTGPGIAPADMDRVFDRFFRGDPAHTPNEGSGLGLAIAKWVTTAHKGRIEVLSKPCQWTEVRVLLPLKSVAHQHPSNHSGANLASGNSRLLSQAGLPNE
jgi:signal transduction histidine kinase